MESIANCETKTGFLVDLGAHEYRNYKVVQFLTEAQRMEYLQRAGRTAVQVESQTVDTGERRVFFGHEAKHLITTIKRGDTNSPGGEEVIDAWYIDHERPDLYCAPDFVHSEAYYVVATGLVDYPDVAQFHHTGPLPTGLVVQLKMTHSFVTNKNGIAGRTITIEETIEDISDSPVSPTVFELPKGLHENPQLLGGRVPRTQGVIVFFGCALLLIFVAAMGIRLLRSLSR